MQVNFDTAIASFIEGANRLLDEGINKTVPTGNYRKKISVQSGRKYVRLVISEGPHEYAVSAFGFIDKETGNVLKAACWKFPAKNYARGNIYDKDNGLGRFHWTGMR